MLDFIPEAEHAEIAAGTSTHDATSAFNSFIAECCGQWKNGYIPAGTYLLDNMSTTHRWGGTLRLRSDEEGATLKRKPNSITANFERLLTLQSGEGTLILQNIRTDSDGDTQDVGDITYYAANRQQCHDISITTHPSDQGVSVEVYNYRCDNSVGAGITIGGTGWLRSLIARNIGGSNRPHIRGDIEVTTCFGQIDVDGFAAPALVIEPTGAMDLSKSHTAVIRNAQCHTLVWDLTTGMTEPMPSLTLTDVDVEYKLAFAGGRIEGHRVNLTGDDSYFLRFASCEAHMIDCDLHVGGVYDAAIGFGYPYRLTLEDVTLTHNCALAIAAGDTQDDTSYLRIIDSTINGIVEVRGGVYEFTRVDFTYAGSGAAVRAVNTHGADLVTGSNQITFDDVTYLGTLYSWNGVGNEPVLTIT